MAMLHFPARILYNVASDPYLLLKIAKNYRSPDRGGLCGSDTDERRL
jgi:hypothetical protein